MRKAFAASLLGLALLTGCGGTSPAAEPAPPTSRPAITEPGTPAPDPDAGAALRGLWDEVQATLPAGAPAFLPEEVCVPTWYSDEEPAAGWPDDLDGCLTGEDARRAVELGGLGEGRTFAMGGRPVRVLVVPQLPQP